VPLSATLIPTMSAISKQSFLQLKTSGDDLRRIRRYPKAFGFGVSDGYLRRRLLDSPAASDLTVPPSGSAQPMLCGSNVT
jgi:hypothetical protein